MHNATSIDFEAISYEQLAGSSPEHLDALGFGVIGFGQDTEVAIYNQTESRLAGLSPDRVVGKPYFAIVAPCMNNYLVAQRFEDEGHLDTVIDYVLTLRMRPTKVRMRLLKQAGEAMRFILIQR